MEMAASWVVARSLAILAHESASFDTSFIGQRRQPVGCISTCSGRSTITARFLRCNLQNHHRVVIYIQTGREEKCGSYEANVANIIKTLIVVYRQQHEFDPHIQKAWFRGNGRRRNSRRVA